MSYTDLRKAVKTSDANQDLNKPGKIYYWNNYLFINEQGKGIHVIDDQNPSQPVFKTFIEIPGNVDISIKDSILYADSYIDLVAIDISDISNIKVVKRIDSIFTYTLPPVPENINMQWDEIDQKKGVVTGYNIKTVEKEFSNPPRIIYPFYDDYRINKVASVQSYSNSNPGVSSPSANSGIGIGGSMARIAIVGNALYAINNSTILIFDISNVTNPVKQNDFYVDWGIETIFPYNNKLFIGSQSGMVVFDITNPFQPTNESTFWHATSCDPVVVQGNYAYITLHSGTTCNSTTVNRLDIVNISNIQNPYLVKSYNMSDPHGLGIDSSTLFICDGDAGLKIYDVTDPVNMTDHLLAAYPDNKAMDVIPLGKILFMIGEQGFFQYDYRNLKNITLLSQINVKE